MIRFGRLAIGLSALTGAMILQALIPPTDDHMLAGALLDAGHVPLFGLVALLLLSLLRATVSFVGSARLLHYFIALVLVVGLGLATEFVQKFGARDAGWNDFGRDLLGGSAALLVMLALDRVAWSGPLVLRICFGLCAVALVGLGLFEVVRVRADYAARDAAFPSLAEFDAAWELRFVHGRDADLVQVRAPAGWEKSAGSRVGRLDTHVAGYPSLSVREPYPDWRGYRALEFEVWSDLDAPLEIVVRVHDRDHNQSYSDRFNGVFAVNPGASRISIPLTDIESGPAHRLLDVGAVAGIAIFLDRPDKPHRLWFDRLELVQD